MTDQKVTPCEFVAGLCSNCGESERGECEGWVAPDDRVQSLADQIEALKKERDALALGVEQWRVDFHELRLEHDALAAAGKLALDFVGFCWRDVTLNEYAEDRRGNVEIALRQAGVQ